MLNFKDKAIFDYIVSGSEIGLQVDKTIDDTITLTKKELEAILYEIELHEPD